MVKKKQGRTSLRDSEETRSRLVAAVGTILERKGYQGLGVNAVAREAGVDKVLVYRYFGGLPGLVQAFAMQGDFWPSFEELTEGTPVLSEDVDVAEVSPRLAINYLRALRKRPLTCELLAWELVEGGESVTVLEKLREDAAKRYMSLLGRIRQDGLDAGRDPDASSALITAAINYLGIRSRRPGAFNGLDLGKEEDWERLEFVLHGMITAWIRSRRPGK
jgi:AcrR family transcriptional regulator